MLIKCSVNGLRRPGVMCGFVIVGNKSCGFSGGCEYKLKTVEAHQSSESTNNTVKLQRSGSFGGAA